MSPLENIFILHACLAYTYPVWCRRLHIPREGHILISGQCKSRKSTEMDNFASAFPNAVGCESSIEAHHVEPGCPEHHEERDVGPEVIAIGYSVVLCKRCEVGCICISYHDISIIVLLRLTDEPKVEEKLDGRCFMSWCEALRLIVPAIHGRWKPWYWCLFFRSVVTVVG